ncbi:MAG: hypothetical protein M1830_005186 [Pleopsidium flavum]|nr:MAG: hypothetical protein M1830_005186 [Pleopsidium flavum]
MNRLGPLRKPFDQGIIAAGFLKSSPKITLFPKPSKPSAIQTRNASNTYAQQSTIHSSSQTPAASPQARADSPFRPPLSAPAPPRATATWVCPICSFSNPVPENFDPSTVSGLTPIAPCLACGIKPPWTAVLKAAISNASTRKPPYAPDLETQEPPSRADKGVTTEPSVSIVSDSAFKCPRCTFLNHPSLLTCELCGAPLISANRPQTEPHCSWASRSESPGPSLNGVTFNVSDMGESVKFSFRAGGEKIFYERLKGAIVQRKWLLQNAPPIPKPVAPSNYGTDALANFTNGEIAQRHKEPHKTVGIAGLERRGLEMRKNNETVISNAFKDLEGLMASAKEIVALAETFSKQSAEGSSEASELLSESATALGMITTKDMLGSGSSSESLYLSELSRNLAEYLTDDSRGILRREGGIMSLVDLWAVFNRARGGVELVSPSDFERSARLWEKLKLPVRLRQFKSGLLVVQRYDWNDQKTIAQLLAWLKALRSCPPPSGVQWDWTAFGRGVTAQDTAERFGWSVGVATEELELAEERGALCREEGIEGLRFWENWLIETDNVDGGLSAV